MTKTSRTKFVSIVLKNSRTSNQTCKPQDTIFTITTFVFAHKTPRLRDSFLKGSTSQEHDGNDVSTFLLPSLSFFRSDIEANPCIERYRPASFRRETSGRPWCGGGWLPAKAVFVDKCPFNREEVSLFTLCFLCCVFPLYHGTRCAGSRRQLEIGHEHTCVYGGRGTEGVVWQVDRYAWVRSVFLAANKTIEEDVSPVWNLYLTTVCPNSREEISWIRSIVEPFDSNGD